MGKRKGKEGWRNEKGWREVGKEGRREGVKKRACVRTASYPGPSLKEHFLGEGRGYEASAVMGTEGQRPHPPATPPYRL